ncbi:MAG: ThiF family adenylyltransferase [Elusimicrobia bacterium]|nr:ThiF family adenylyltransferase [Elusimicrobiota bacterium]
MIEKRIIPENLRRARRTLDEINSVKTVNNWEYDKGRDNWYLKIQISLNLNSDIIPNISNWYIVTGEEYPLSNIEIYPSITNSLTFTLQHQSCNFYTYNNLWRCGKLCLDISGIKEKSSEEKYYKNPNYKLYWYVKRAIEWIIQASKNSLVQKNDFFELPDFFEKYNTDIFVFNEDNLSFMKWNTITQNRGYAYLSIYDKNKKNTQNIYVLRKFTDLKNNELFVCNWGELFNNLEISTICGLWIKLKKTPVVNIWQAPMTISELQKIFNEENIDLFDFLQQVDETKIRNRQQNLLLVGFPIPKKISSKNEKIFWQAIKLPILSTRKSARGFRHNKLIYYDKQNILTPNRNLCWIKSQNLNPNEISVRGKLDINIINKKFLLIGAGCIGSTFSELLIRAGAQDITIIDNDTLTFGNLSRHTLNIDDISSSKADNLALRLNKLSPHAKVKSLNKLISSGFNFNDFDVILECSGSNEVLQVIENSTLMKETSLLSISIGIDAEYLFLSFHNKNKFNFYNFKNLIKNYIKSDEELQKYNNLREGFGCWHPIFPARIDDIWLTSCTAFNFFEQCILGNKSELSIVYQKNKDGFTYHYKEVNKI